MDYGLKKWTNYNYLHTHIFRHTLTRARRMVDAARFLFMNHNCFGGIYKASSPSKKMSWRGKGERTPGQYPPIL